MKIKTTVAVLALVAVAACGAEDERERIPLGEQGVEAEAGQAAPRLPEGVQARVDSGNAAYARGSYEEAAELFQEIADEHPDLTVGWFGLYMAETKLGNADAAQAAMARVESLSPGLAPMHEKVRDSTHMRMMQGHPGGAAMPQDSIHRPGPEGGEM